MTNQTALVLALLGTATIVVVAFFHGAEPFIFLGKELLELINWIAFWR
jgi:hypothetical protein